MLLKVILFSIILHASNIVVKGTPQQLAEITALCCTQGVDYTRLYPDNDVSSCSDILPDSSIPKKMIPICNLAIEECCSDSYLNTSCSTGISLAKEKKCNTAKSESVRSCCNECSFGYLAGQNSKGNEDSSVCSVRNDSDEEQSTSFKLRKEAFKKCCLEAIKEKNPQKKQPDKDATKKRDEKSSLCEQYAPNELCAHHCIPIPGSYRCECNPGYMLMADKNNCKKIDKNRCKDKNPCEHKCTDTGKDIKCSCRRGYKLRADGKSCEDIDECQLNSSLCLEESTCENTEGSFKCIPKKRSNGLNEKCPSGYVWNNVNNVCDDINECELSTPPCKKSLCTNTVGSYKCKGSTITSLAVPPDEDRCPAGFRSGDEVECEDIDECQENKDDCNRKSQYCVNTLGSFTCQNMKSRKCDPGFQINEATGICQDIDECAEPNSDYCADDQVCKNLPGAFICLDKAPGNQMKSKTCREGLRMNKRNQKCEDIDECIEGTHICDGFQICVNTYGGHKCECKTGYELEPTTMACVDINECLSPDLNQCVPDSQRCINTVGSFTCVRTLPCGTGYSLQGNTGKCVDVDECVHNLHDCDKAGPNYVCVNLPGAFRCVEKTTAETAYEYEYYDYEEENTTSTTKAPSSTTKKQTTTTKKPKVTTTKQSTTTTSTQKPSTKATEKSTKIPSPTINETIPPYSQTTQSTPRFTYTTTPNTFIVKPKTSTEGLRRDPQIVLVQKPDTPTATIPGYRKPNNAFVVNTKDIPENTWTTVVEGPREEEKEFDENKKHCITGYVKNKEGDCVDINECHTNNKCSNISEVCVNTDGGYLCECTTGYRKDHLSGMCKPIYQATSSRPTIYTYTTRKRNPCDEGYDFNADTQQCEDVNECLRSAATCARDELCENTAGGYRCICAQGWILDHALHRCIPKQQPDDVIPPGYANIDPDDKPEEKNIITVGSRFGQIGNHIIEPDIKTLPNTHVTVTACPWGYKLNHIRMCVDVDECELGTSACGPTQTCINKPGGYICKCPPGHKQVEQNACEDIDECAIAQGRYCSPNSDCVNTVGSFKCKCHQGFRTTLLNDKVCADIDECVENKPGTLCEHNCNNVWGTYRCTCNTGYKLNKDNRTCSDINECEEFAGRNLCLGKCLNEPGSYRCICPRGYRLNFDKKSCIDINECETGEATCANAGSNVVCQNTRGSYRCYSITCPPGYDLQPKHRCTKVSRYCNPNDHNCTHEPATFSYNFITFVSNLYIPPEDSVSLFTMKGRISEGALLRFEHRLVKVNAPPSVKRVADLSYFRLMPSSREAVVALVKPIEGPQNIQLDVSMELYSVDGQFKGKALAKIFIDVSEYEF